MRYSGVPSAVAPQSMSTIFPFAVGTTGASAARRMPRMRLMSRVAAESSAPVEPAETKASPFLALSRFRPTVMEESGLSLKARAGLSSMVMTSLAGAISTPWGRSVLPSLFRQSRMTASGPVKIISTPKSSAARRAPSTGARGALSPPMASTIIFISFAFLGQRQSSPSRASKARWDRAAFLFRLPFTR